MGERKPCLGSALGRPLPLPRSTGERGLKFCFTEFVGRRQRCGRPSPITLNKQLPYMWDQARMTLQAETALSFARDHPKRILGGFPVNGKNSWVAHKYES